MNVTLKDELVDAITLHFKVKTRFDGYSFYAMYCKSLSKTGEYYVLN